MAHLCSVTGGCASRCSKSCTTAADGEGAVRQTHDDMVDAFPTDRADEPFDIGVLPGRAQRCRSISDAERPKALGHDLPISAISITNEVPRSMLPSAL